MQAWAGCLEGQDLAKNIKPHKHVIALAAIVGTLRVAGSEHGLCRQLLYLHTWCDVLAWCKSSAPGWTLSLWVYYIWGGIFTMQIFHMLHAANILNWFLGIFRSNNQYCVKSKPSLNKVVNCSQLNVPTPWIRGIKEVLQMARELSRCCCCSQTVCEKNYKWYLPFN